MRKRVARIRSVFEPAEHIPGISLVSFAVIYTILGLQIEYSFSSDPLGPRTFPVILGIVLAVLSVWYILQPGTSEEWPRGRLLRRVIGFLALATICLGFLELLGFPLATFLLCGGTAQLFRATQTQALACGVGNAALWYVTFTKVFGVMLPLGTVFTGW